MLFKSDSEYAIYNPITEKEWNKFFTYVDLRRLGKQQKIELIDKIKKEAQQSIMARKLVRRHINQKNPTTITFLHLDNETGATYFGDSDNVEMQDINSDFFFHELMHDQQNVVGFDRDCLDQKESFISNKLSEAETNALNGSLGNYNNNILYLLLKANAIEQCQEKISKKQFKAMNIVQNDASFDEAYKVFIDIEATKLAMGQSILMDMQPFGKEALILAEKFNAPIQKYELSNGKVASAAAIGRDWKNAYNHQAARLSEQRRATARLGGIDYDTRKHIQNYLETEYPFLKGKNYFQTGLNSDEAYAYGYGLKPKPLKIGTTIDNETQIKTTVEKTKNGYVETLTKNGVKIYDCYYNNDGFRDGKETFYNRNNNRNESILWKNGYQVDLNGKKIDLRGRDIDRKKQTKSQIENVTHMVQGLPKYIQVFRNKQVDCVFDMRTGRSIAFKNISNVSADKIVQEMKKEDNQFEQIKNELLNIPTKGKASHISGTATYYPSGHLEGYESENNYIHYNSDGLNYYVDYMMINGKHYNYYKPENGEKIGKCKTAMSHNSHYSFKFDFRKDGTLLSSTVGNTQTDVAQTITYKSDGKTIHSTGDVIFGKDLTEIKDGKWIERKGDTEVHFEYTQNRIDNVGVIGNPQKAMSDILFADIAPDCMTSLSKTDTHMQPSTSSYKQNLEDKSVNKTPIAQKNIEISPKVKKYKINESSFSPKYSFLTENKYNVDGKSLVWFEKDTDGNDISTSVVDLDIELAVKGDGLDQRDVMNRFEQDLASLDECDLLELMRVGCGKSSGTCGVPSKKDGIKIDTNKYNDGVSVCFIDEETKTGKVFQFKKTANMLEKKYVLSAEGYGVFNGDSYTKHGEWIEYDHSKIFDKKTYKTYNNGKEVSDKSNGMIGALSNAANQPDTFSETKKESALADNAVSVQDNADTQILDMLQNNRTC